MSLVIGPSVNAAQADTSLEQAYARECPRHEKTAACNALRAAMQQHAENPAAKVPSPMRETGAAVWGEWALLAGTVWRSSSGVYYRYRWEQPYEVMLTEVVSSGSFHLHRVSRTPEGKLRLLLQSGDIGSITFPRPGIVIQDFGSRRTIMRFDSDLIRLEEETLVQGTWKPETIIGERRPANDSDFEAASDRLAEKQRIVEATWGKLPQLPGFWTNGRSVWRAYWNKSKSLLTASVYDVSGEYRDAFYFYPDESSRLHATSGVSNYKVEMLPHGNMFLDGPDDAIIWRSPSAFVFENGRMRDGAYVRKESQDAWRNGTFRKMSTAEAQRFRQQITRYEQQQASRGDSGLLGALAMATGAALAGGNAEHVMGAAMKGAELTTDNEMSRNVLAGQGDAMIASGTRTMVTESAQRSQTATTAHGVRTTSSITPVARTDPNGPGQVKAGANSTGLPGAPIRFYYVVSMVPTEGETRNPMCISNVVTLPQRLDPDPWRQREKAMPLVEPYRERFIARCSRLGQISSLGNVYYTIEGLDSGWPYPSFHPTDRRVSLP